MENATQALLIGAGVLIGVIILTMAVYLFNVFGGHAVNVQNKIDEQQIAKFNNQFLNYSGSKNLTIQDIITAKNYALENNKQYSGYDVDNDRAGKDNSYVDVYCGELKTTAITEAPRAFIMNISDEQLLNTEMENIKNGKDAKRFTCHVKINSTTGRVNKVYFYAAT